jgi:hypothetical protein
MRRRAVTWGCLLLLAPTLFALHAGCRSTSISTGSLAGTVRDAATNDPIEGAEVAVGAAATLTDAGGRFTLDELELGDRPFTVTATGYQVLKKTVTIEAGDNTVVFELLPHARTDGGLPQDAPVQHDAAQHDAAQNDAATCSGASCTYGYAYDQCCYQAQYCVANACRATCGSVGERCGYHSDCCQGNCVSGYCATPSCAGNACSYGYAYNGCCYEAQYCVSYSGSLACRASCGNTNERCAYASDCCSGLTCTSNYCVAPTCAGNTCTYGYYTGGGCCTAAPYCTNPSGYSYSSCRATCGNVGELCSGAGDCCASAPYCRNYYSQPTICQTTCGAASNHCVSNSDCCSNSCTYNSSAGWNTCN